MSWTSIADLLTADERAPVALLGAPMEAGSVTPGRCDLAPAAVRKAMKRISTYDLVEGTATTADDAGLAGSLARIPNGSVTDDASADWELVTRVTPGASNDEM